MIDNKTQNAIEVTGLTKRFGGLVAVDQISLAVKPGEIFGFLGPNGAGKTTTIRMLTGLSQPTGGKASILGFDVHSDIIRIKKRIGVVPETSNLYDELSGRDNLLFMAQLYGVPRNRRKERVDDLLKTFGLYERKDSLFRTVSRGMKRALTIAAALVHEPEVIFLDEPTAGLDVVAARSLRNLIGHMRRQDTTVFLTTHYLEEANLLCDRIAIIVKGKIVKIDTPQALKEFTGMDNLEDAFIKITGLGSTAMAIEKGGAYNVAR
jgi:ABC-2 type transport system ATP-binding protein